MIESKKLLQQFMDKSKLERRYIVFVADEDYKEVADGTGGIRNLIATMPWYVFLMFFRDDFRTFPQNGDPHESVPGNQAHPAPSQHS